MSNEEVLQKTLGMVLERLAKQVLEYETQIANLNAQLILMAAQQQRKVQEPENFDRNTLAELEPEAKPTKTTRTRAKKAQ
jgi:hypothetical protein